MASSAWQVRVGVRGCEGLRECACAGLAWGVQGGGWGVRGAARGVHAALACSGSGFFCGWTLMRLALAAKRSVERVSPWLIAAGETAAMST